MVLAAVALVMVRRAGVAVAGSLAGTEDREVLDGTGRDEVLSDLAGGTLNGFGSEDSVKGGDGVDEVSGAVGGPIKSTATRRTTT